MDTYKALLLYFLFIPAIASAHGGRTDKYGCHNDRKHGGYHCHNSGAPSPSYSPAVNSVNSSTTKVPAPTAQPVNPPVKERNLAAYANLVLQIQTELNRLGYSVGKPDGVLGDKTLKAIKHFQVDNDLAVDGKPSYLLLDVLVKKIK